MAESRIVLLLEPEARNTRMRRIYCTGVRGRRTRPNLSVARDPAADFGEPEAFFTTTNEDPRLARTGDADGGFSNRNGSYLKERKGIVMKDYGTGIIRCKCSHAMRRRRNVRVTESTPARWACPNCGNMLRIIHRTFVAPRRAGVTAEKKRKGRERTNAHVLRLEAENKALRNVGTLEFEGQR